MNTLVTLSALFAVAFSSTALIHSKTTALSTIPSDVIGEILTTSYPRIVSVTKRPTNYWALMIKAPSPLIVPVTKMSGVSFVRVSVPVCPANFNSTVETTALPVPTLNVSLPLVRKHGKWSKRRLTGREQLTKQRKRMTSLAHKISRHMPSFDFDVTCLMIIGLLEFALIYGVGDIVEEVYPEPTGPAHIFPAPSEAVRVSVTAPILYRAKDVVLRRSTPMEVRLVRFSRGIDLEIEKKEKTETQC